MKRWQTVAKIIVALVSIVLITTTWGGMDEAHAAFWGRSRTADTQKTIKATGKISEASPPIAIQELRQALDDYQPQVTILSPRKNEVLADNMVSVRFLVKDLPVFKDETFGLGPHLHVLLDNQPYQAVYDTNQPLVFSDLEPGTHTIRAFASRPWHESFKNEGAFAQITFHVLTKTQDNQPNPDLPLLTYSRPQGIYGAEPILLDFYLTNAPLHLIAQVDQTDDIADWRIRCTVNGDSFVIDRWQPLYLKGFKPGKNWVQLEYLDDKGNPVQNVFNNTVRLVDYQPNGNDTLSKLVRGDLSAADVRGIVDPNYIPPALTPEPPPPTPEPTPEPTLEEPTPEPTPKASPEPSTPSMVAPQPKPTSNPIVPPPSITPPSVTSSPEPTLEPSTASSSTPESGISSEPAAALNENLPPETPAVKPPALSKVQPVSPEIATPNAPKASSGQERLRQLRQQFGQYSPQRKAIVPSSSASPRASSERSKTVPGNELNSTPSVSIPESLPPTLPEIIEAVPLEAPSSSKPALSETGKPREH